MKKSILCVLLSSAVALFSLAAQANHHEGKAHGDMFNTSSDGFIDEAEKKAGHDKMRAMRKEHTKHYHEKMDNIPTAQ
jgi:hypothetical protein